MLTPAALAIFSDQTVRAQTKQPQSTASQCDNRMALPYIQHTPPFSTCHNYHSQHDKPIFSPIYPTALSYPSDSSVTMATKPTKQSTMLPTNKTKRSYSKALVTQTDSGISASTPSHPMRPLLRNSVMLPTTSTSSKTKETSYDTCIKLAAVPSLQPGSQQLKRVISPRGPASQPT
jgi:hypothetical protein